jgi:hypothetical protein
MSRRMALIRTEVSEELSASFIRVTRLGELGTTLAVTSKRLTQYVSFSSKNSVTSDCSETDLNNWRFGATV